MSTTRHVSWRALLARAIASPSERASLARTIGVSSRTLSRWAAGGQLPTQPFDRLQRLVAAMPEQRDALIASITAEYPDFIMSSIPTTHYSIPAEHYRTILERAALIPDALRFTACARALAESLVAQLDAGLHGVYITICSCARAEGEVSVRSLSALILARTAPWQPLREEAVPYPVDGETLEGYTAMTGVLHYIGNTREYVGTLPFEPWEHIDSICVVPVRRAARIAGVLSVASSQSGYFGEQARRDLVEQYAYLAMVLYDDNEFYAAEWIALE